MIMGFKDIKSLYPNLDRDDYQPNSLDLRLDKICEIPLALDEGVVGIFDSTKLIPRPKEIEKEELYGISGYVLQPKTSYIAFVKGNKEDGKMEIPKNIAQFYLPRSTLLRCGVSLDTALGDSGFVGHLQFLITNNSLNPFFISANERIATCISFEVKNGTLYDGDYNEKD